MAPTPPTNNPDTSDRTETNMDERETSTATTLTQNTTGPGAQGDEAEIIHRQFNKHIQKKHTQKHSGITYQTIQKEEEYTTT